jgi:hypothetical protein
MGADALVHLLQLPKRDCKQRVAIAARQTTNSSTRFTLPDTLLQKALIAPTIAATATKGLHCVQIRGMIPAELSDLEHVSFGNPSGLRVCPAA